MDECGPRLCHVPACHYRFVRTKTKARNRKADGYRAPVLSFGTAESVSNQVKSLAQVASASAVGF